MTDADKITLLTQALQRAAGTLETLSDVRPHELDLANGIARREAGLAREELGRVMA